MSADEIYLGDGLYASFDGFTFWLRASRSDGDHWVALEPMVVKAFLTFIEDTKITHGTMFEEACEP